MITFYFEVYKPYEDDGDRLESGTVDAESKEQALEILQDAWEGVYFPDLGDKLMKFYGGDDDA